MDAADLIPGVGVSPTSPEGQAMLQKVREQSMQIGLGLTGGGPASKVAQILAARTPGQWEVISNLSGPVLNAGTRAELYRLAEHYGIPLGENTGYKVQWKSFGK